MEGKRKAEALPTRLALLRHDVGWTDHKGPTMEHLSGQITDGRKALRMKVAKHRVGKPPTAKHNVGIVHVGAF
jgi:hypothetical protein